MSQKVPSWFRAVLGRSYLYVFLSPHSSMLALTAVYSPDALAKSFSQYCVNMGADWTLQ